MSQQIKALLQTKEDLTKAKRKTSDLLSALGEPDTRNIILKAFSRNNWLDIEISDDKEREKLSHFLADKLDDVDAELGKVTRKIEAINELLTQD